MLNCKQGCSMVAVKTNDVSFSVPRGDDVALVRKLPRNFVGIVIRNDDNLDGRFAFRTLAPSRNGSCRHKHEEGECTRRKSRVNCRHWYQFGGQTPKIIKPLQSNTLAPPRVASKIGSECRRICYFCRMAHDPSHDHGHHGEPEQNEIGGPVVFCADSVWIGDYHHRLLGVVQSARSL